MAQCTFSQFALKVSLNPNQSIIDDCESSLSVFYIIWQLFIKCLLFLVV